MSFIVGRQSMPREFRRKFDIVTCSENLGTNLFPAKCFDNMVEALKPSGYAVFTIPTKHLESDNIFNTGYAQAIERLITVRRVWSPVHHLQFKKNKRYSLMS